MNRLDFSLETESKLSLPSDDKSLEKVHLTEYNNAGSQWIPRHCDWG